MNFKFTFDIKYLQKQVKEFLNTDTEFEEENLEGLISHSSFDQLPLIREKVSEEIDYLGQKDLDYFHNKGYETSMNYISLLKERHIPVEPLVHKVITFLKYEHDNLTDSAIKEDCKQKIDQLYKTHPPLKKVHKYEN